MNRRTLLALLAAAPVASLLLARPGLAQPAAPPPNAAPGGPGFGSPQDGVDLARVESYLNSFTSLKARFQQIAPDGQITTGTAWLERPGRMRFQYDPPSPLLLVAGHGLLVYVDSQLQQTTNIPLDRTPLSLLLAGTVRLTGDATVTGIHREPGLLEVSLVRTATPGEGTLTLVFGDNPLVLREWIVTDAQRRETRVALQDVRLGGKFDPSLFTFVDPKAMQGGPGG